MPSSRPLEVLAASTTAMLTGVRADLLDVATDPATEAGRGALLHEIDAAICALHRLARTADRSVAIGVRPCSP